jgi:hypothetical protein
VSEICDPVCVCVVVKIIGTVEEVMMMMVEMGNEEKG